MSESLVFELKLQIQHLEEKLTFLAGGTNEAELVEVLMEKDEDLERKVGRSRRTPVHIISCHIQRSCLLSRLFVLVV